MEWLKGEFSKSNIISGLLALGVFGTIIYLSVMQLPIPEILILLAGTIGGFFFGSKKGLAEATRRAMTPLHRKEGSSNNGRH